MILFSRSRTTTTKMLSPMARVLVSGRTKKELAMRQAARQVERSSPLAASSGSETAAKPTGLAADDHRRLARAIAPSGLAGFPTPTGIGRWEAGTRLGMALGRCA
mmetsp:Transcript_52856/g.139555  ORF Transcript_52856/g.139555 Transcript_52856/m.139555 type:complete len:105 (+) Transcript_52856:1847-2161(+)